MTAPTRRHVIVGDGITALAFLDTRTARAGEDIILIGRNASEFGRGQAYAKGDETPWRYAYLLNSPADDIDPAFAHWLSDRWDLVADTMRGRAPDWLSAAAPLVERGDVYGVNAPREFYGDYMREQALAAIARLTAAGVTVQAVDADAQQLRTGTDGTLTLMTSAGSYDCDSLDVAPGGPSTLRIPGDDGAFAAPSVFGHEHRIADHIRAGREIFCIGGNAAMLDVLRLCQSLVTEDALRFVACAPDGEVPAPLIPRLPRRFTKPTLSRGHGTAESFLAEIWREIEMAKRGGDEMREIRAGFRAHFLENPLEGYVTDPAEARRVPSKLRFWLRGGTRDTILDMMRLVNAGKTRVIAGAVRAVEHGSDGARVIIEDRAGGEQSYDTGFVVNCAGAGPGSRYDPLTEDLLAQDAISICPISRGIAVGERCQTAIAGVRYLSPSTTVIGTESMAMPLYDAHMLRTYAARAQQT
ncbi:MAG: FAD/NAD(P)-binding protein [Pseudomonadota bacterium]